ncbi:MAG TPA: hypothetical protein VFF41_01035 [Gallionella sp.]|nr:hypothetical protein [Gallionella sp.]
MDILEQIKKVEAHDLVKIVTAFVGVISPGLLTLFLFKRDLFVSLDLMKLVLLSASLSLPIVLLNYFLLSIIPSAKKSTNEISEKRFILANLFTASLMSATFFYGALVVAYFLGFKLYAFMWTLTIFQISA